MTRIRGVISTVGPSVTKPNVEVNPFPFAGFPTSITRATTSVNVGVAATLLLAAKSTRVSLLIYNNSTNTVFLGDAGVTLANGLPLVSGGTYSNDNWVGAVYAISAVAASNVRMEEN